MKTRTEKPKIISIPGVAIILFLNTALLIILLTSANQAILSQNSTQDDILFSGIDALNPEKGWSFNEKVGFLFASGLTVSLIGTICLWLIRRILPEKYKPYITWKLLNMVGK